MLAVAGFTMIVIMVVLLIKFRMLPVTVFSTLPFAAALIIGTSFPDTIYAMAKGIVQVLPITALFISSITFFGIMNDIGLFDKPINWLIKRINNNILALFIITGCVTMLTHLDGEGTTTILITVPALLPIVKKLKIRVLPFAFIMNMMIAAMNFLPWAGPLARAAAVTGVEPSVLWRQVLPVQVFGIALTFGMCFILAREEKKRGFFIPVDVNTLGKNIALDEEPIQSDTSELKKPTLIWFNAILSVIVIGSLFAGLPAFLPFIIGAGIALFVNYGKGGEQAQIARIKAHAATIMPMIFTILCAGIFLGVLKETKMIDSMSEVIVSIVPQAFGSFLHIIMGILAIPVSLVFDADTLNYGLLPIITQVSSQYGIEPAKAALSLVMGHNIGISLCMTNATVYFGLAMYGLQYGEAFKYSFWRRMVFGTILVLFAALIRVI